MTSTRLFASQRALILRNVAEYVVIILIWLAVTGVIRNSGSSPGWQTILVLVTAWMKTAFFGSENLQQLWRASRENTAYHHFMVLMLVNMSQIIFSFGCDYHCLHLINPDSFGSISEGLPTAELLFEFTYFSVLNFTFFGYGDITPQTIPAKLLTVTEVVLAFVTVIFLLSDFISLKESLRPNSKTNEPSGDN